MEQNKFILHEYFDTIFMQNVTSNVGTKTNPLLAIKVYRTFLKQQLTTA
jgi:hypothetical protein